MAKGERTTGLLIGAWIVFALDLVILLLMVRELAGTALPEEERGYATWATWMFALWLGVVNVTLVASWWRGSRAGLWAALICGGIPLLWAWTMVVQAVSDAAGGGR